MSLTVRRIIFYCLLGVFIVAAPIIVGYTTGYRYSIKQRRIVTTGIISAQSNPEQADIYLNGALYKDRTPALITDLTPGSYNIKIVRDGFHPWSKTLNVESEQSAFTGPVMLFKNALPTLIVDISEITRFEPFPLDPNSVRYEKKRNTVVVTDKKRGITLDELPGDRAIMLNLNPPILFTVGAHELWQYNFETRERKLLTRLLEEIKNVIPFPGGSAVIIALPDRIRALELDLRNVQNSWELAKFDEIKKTSLAEDGKALFIEGTREGKTGTWKLEL